MEIKVKRTGLPPELEIAIAAYTAALAAGDHGGATALVDGRADAAVIARVASIGPAGRVDVIARARLGHQYLVKLRLTGAAGTTMTLQSRWHKANGGAWRLIEVEDAGLQSPWQKPEAGAPHKCVVEKADG